MKKTIFIWVFCCISILAVGQSEFKVAFYNVLNYPLETTPPNRIQFLNTIMPELAPDIFMACEINTEEGAREILSVIKNTVRPSFNMAPYVNNTSDDTFNDKNELQNIIYYDTDLFLLSEQTTITSEFRDFNHYQLQLKTTNSSNPIFIEIIVCHLKSQDGVDNENIRKDMVDDLQVFLDTLPTESNVILAGDFNIYRATEPAFVELLDSSNNITFVDPAQRVGNWHNNSSFIDVFTQSTRRTSGLGGASGGFDDRFDFILTSTTLQSGGELSFIEDSYTTLGNNNNPNCYNQDINSSRCAGDDYSFELRNALFNFSDHLPISLDLRTNETLSINSLSINNSFEIIGTNVVSDRLRLKLNEQTSIKSNLDIYNHFGQLVKSLNTKNSVYVEQNVSNWANGLYYILDASKRTKPLKFIVSH